jgi:hypothetical protein
MRRQIIWCGDDNHAHVRPDWHRDHILVHDLADPHACVVLLGDDIREAIVNDDLDLDVRVFGKELIDSGPQHILCRVLVSGNAHGASRLFP